MSAVEGLSRKVAQALTFGEDARVRYAENIGTRERMLELIGSLAAAVAGAPGLMQELKDHHVRSSQVNREAVEILGSSATQLEGIAEETANPALVYAAKLTRQAEDYGLAVTPDEMYRELGEEIGGVAGEFWGLINRLAKLKGAVETIGRYEGNGALNSIEEARRAGIRYTHEIGVPIAPLPGDNAG